MKKIIITFVFCLFYSNISKAQWLSDIRLTNDPAQSYMSNPNKHCIASSGNVLHVVWYDQRTNWNIYYKRSTDAGLTWSSDTRISNGPSESHEPSIAVSGSLVHVVWHDNRNTDWKIFYVRSTDVGISWSTDTQLTNSPLRSVDACIAATGSFLHTVWSDYRNGGTEIYYKHSTNNGLIWGVDTRLTYDTAYSDVPSVAVSGSIVHVAWLDYRDGNSEIYYKRSTDNGVTWGADVRLTNNTAVSYCVFITVSGSIVHVVWRDERDGNREIYYKRSTDAGITWGADIRMTNNSAESDSPDLTASGSNLHLTWQDSRDGNFEIYYKLSTDNGITWGPDTRLTNYSGNSLRSFNTVTGTTVHVVWMDERDGNWEIYYKRNPTGNPVSIKKINIDVPKEYFLYQNYPNPFNPTTKIKFNIAVDRGRKSEVRLVIYDILGKEIVTLVNEKLQAGTYEVEWNGSNYSSGVYFYQLKTESYTQTKKLVLLK